MNPQQGFSLLDIPLTMLFAIDLKETFLPKVAKAYLLNLKEMDACKKFIEEHLNSGKICKSATLPYLNGPSGGNHY